MSVPGAPGRGPSNGKEWRAPTDSSHDDPAGYSEITLADIVHTLQKRKLVLVAVFLVTLLAGVGITAATTPQYESTATLIPIEHSNIIRNWLDSRLAAEIVVDRVGDPVFAALFPGRFDSSTGTWDGREPSLQEAGSRLQSATTIGSGSAAGDQLIEITVRLPSASVARDAAQGYVRSLDELRPSLENLTRQDRFQAHYTGENEQEARRLAEVEAQGREYWVPLDRANLPGSAVVPNTTLNISLAVVLGLMLGVFGVFLTEWVSSYRAQSARRVDVPVPPRAREEESPVDEKPAEAKAPVRRYR